MKKGMCVICLIILSSLLVSCSNDHKNKKEENADIANKEYVTLSIDEINDGYFLGQHPWPSPRSYKVYAELDEDFCIGDYVDVYYDVMTLVDSENYEITAIAVKISDFKLEPGKAYKPVIYLYPTDITDVSVSLDYNGVLTHTYPVYSGEWNVTAYPDGTLIDHQGNKYPYLFWEGESDIKYDLTKGFCIAGDETVQFLREKLEFMGLNDKELSDFINFWVPFMVKNQYNKITFQTSEYTENAKLTVNPQPDSILRIYMVYQPLKEYVDIEEQTLCQFQRKGFTVVEWGGSIIEE